MKVSLMADIHANLPALEIALHIGKEEQVDMHLVAGDLLGFYPFPCEVVDKLRQTLGSDDKVVKGNHDHRIATGEEFPESFSATVMGRWQREVLTEDRLDFIGALPSSMLFEIEGCRILMVHGSPSDPLEGRINGPLDISQFEAVDVIVFGHTHRPMVHRQDNTLWINPGSVGQPRDGDPRGSLCVLEIPGLKVKEFRYHYDIGSVAQRWKRDCPRELDDRLIQWLRDGRYPDMNEQELLKRRG